MGEVLIKRVGATGKINLRVSDRSPYKRNGDCCLGCPYALCPSRPIRPMETERPNCVWDMYLKMNDK